MPEMGTGRNCGTQKALDSQRGIEFWTAQWLGPYLYFTGRIVLCIELVLARLHF